MDSRKRLAAMVETNDGFELAELDLKLRGYGDLEGTQQIGDITELKLASISKDNDLMLKIREVALQILKDDPQLQSPENEKLRKLSYPEITDFSIIS